LAKPHCSEDDIQMPWLVLTSDPSIQSVLAREAAVREFACKRHIELSS